MNTLIVIALTCLAGTAISSPTNSWRIVGGSEAKDGQFPWQVSLRFLGNPGCGGIIISDQFILTAAHCLKYMGASAVRVVAGSNSLENGGTEYRSEALRMHEDYNSTTHAGDVGLIKLKTKIQFNDKVQPIGLNTEDIGSGETLTLSGWGTTSYPGDTPDKLQWIDLKSISNSECQEWYMKPILKSQICTLTKAGEGACHGDSGGPLVYKGKVAGIVSWGLPCAIGFPDVFTRVSEMIDWIQNNMSSM